jgi:hypothetical protein
MVRYLYSMLIYSSRLNFWGRCHRCSQSSCTTCTLRLLTARRLPKNPIVLSIISMCCLCCFNGAIAHTKSTVQNTTTISSLADLQAIKCGSRATYLLAHDIDGQNANVIPICERKLGERSSKAFNGVIDGQGHTISNLVVNCQGKSHCGILADMLFGAVKNLKLKNIKVNNTHADQANAVGIVAGVAGCSIYHNITIVDSDIDSRRARVGGVVGYALTGSANEFSGIHVDNTIVHTLAGPWSDKSVTCTGGIIGEAELAHIKNTIVHNSPISGAENIGGIVGEFHSGSISKTAYTIDAKYKYRGAPIGGLDRNIGGLIGYGHQAVSIQQSFILCSNNYLHRLPCIYISSLGKENTNGKNAGGLVGYDAGVKIDDSFSQARIAAQQNLGGLVGFYAGDAEHTISNSYSVTTFMNYEQAPQGLVGGAENQQLEIIVDSFWDQDVSGITANIGGGMAEHTGVMQLGQIYQAASWDLASIWNLKEKAYPRLRWYQPGKTHFR